jgi:lipopolysaccharide export system protein LptA
LPQPDKEGREKLIPGNLARLEAGEGVEFAETGAAPRNIKCDRMVWNDTGGVFTFEGAPVELVQESITIRSPEVIVDPESGLVSSQQGGELVAFYQWQGDTSDPKGKDVKRPVRLLWKGDMRYDNEEGKATFWKEVVLTVEDAKLAALNRVVLVLTSAGTLEKGAAYGYVLQPEKGGVDLELGGYHFSGSRAGFDLPGEWFELAGSPARMRAAEALTEARKFRLERWVGSEANVVTAEGVSSATYSASLRLPARAAEELGLSP